MSRKRNWDDEKIGQIMKLRADGMTNSEIAAVMLSTEKAIKTAVSRYIETDKVAPDRYLPEVTTGSHRIYHMDSYRNRAVQLATSALTKQASPFKGIQSSMESVLW